MDHEDPIPSNFKECKHWNAHSMTQQAVNWEVATSNIPRPT